MFVINPSHEIIVNAIDPYIIEVAGRTCYKSESKGDPEKFVQMIKARGHDSVLEHSLLTVRFVTNRGVSHELVRHRLASFSQESTRYVNYEKKGLVVIRPVWTEHNIQGEFNAASVDFQFRGYEIDEQHWMTAMLNAETAYNKLIELGWRPEQAREVLPNSTKTEIVMSANAREWRHIFKLRTAKAAHPEMRRIMIPLLKQLQDSPSNVLFRDLIVEGENPITENKE